MILVRDAISRDFLLFTANIGLFLSTSKMQKLLALRFNGAISYGLIKNSSASVLSKKKTKTNNLLIIITLD